MYGISKVCHGGTESQRFLNIIINLIYYFSVALSPCGKVLILLNIIERDMMLPADNYIS